MHVVGGRRRPRTVHACPTTRLLQYTFPGSLSAYVRVLLDSDTDRDSDSDTRAGRRSAVNNTVGPAGPGGSSQQQAHDDYCMPRF